MTRDELIQITHKLGYDYVWQDWDGDWNASSAKPSFNGESWFVFDAFDDDQFEVYTEIEFDGTKEESLLFYGDTLCQNKAEEAKEVEVRG